VVPLGTYPFAAVVDLRTGTLTTRVALPAGSGATAAGAVAGSTPCSTSTSRLYCASRLNTITVRMPSLIASGIWVMAHPPALVPTVVLAAGFHGAPGAPLDAAFEDLWQELQQEQARALQARFVPVPEGDHFLHQDRPALVVDAVREVVEAARHPGTWATPTP
jgi:pimeloyl-ACP methyl ester carboxylesterase